MYLSRIIFALLPIAVFLAGCAKTDKEAPNTPIATPADIVTCLVDSTPWEASSDKSIGVIEEVVSAEFGTLEGKQTFILTAWNVKSGVANSISIYAEDVLPGSPTELDGKNSRATYTSKTSSSTQPVFFRGPDRPHGSLTITSIDTTRKRVTGTFYCELEGISIAGGQFDTRYSQPIPF